MPRRGARRRPTVRDRWEPTVRAATPQIVPRRDRRRRRPDRRRAARRQRRVAGRRPGHRAVVGGGADALPAAPSACARPTGEVVEEVRAPARLPAGRDRRPATCSINGRRVLHPRRQPPRLRPAHRPRRSPRDAMRADLVLMKQFGFNAVRTSHYPNDPALRGPAPTSSGCTSSTRPTSSRTPSRARCATTRATSAPGSTACRADGPARQEPRLDHRSGRSATSRATAPTTTPRPAGSAATTRRRPLHYEGAIRFDWTSAQTVSDITCPMYPPIAAIVDHATIGHAAPPADHVRVLPRDGQQQRHARRVLGRDRVDARAAGRVHLGVVGPRARPAAARRHDALGVRRRLRRRARTTATSASTAWSGRTGRPKPAMWEHRHLAAPVRIAGRPGRRAGGRIEIQQPAGLPRPGLAARRAGSWRSTASRSPTASWPCRRSRRASADDRRPRRLAGAARTGRASAG